MCLAIPAQIKELKENNLAQVDIMGVSRETSLDLTPEAQVGDFVLVHAGFSIQIIDQRTAQETLDLIRELPDLVEEDLSFAYEAELSND